MSNERYDDNQRQPKQQAQQDKSDEKRHAGKRDDQDKSPRGYDTKSDSQDQEKAGKGKIATSAPGGEKSEPKRF